MVKARTDLQGSIAEDGLIQGLVDYEGTSVEIIAFGIAYCGTLQKVHIAEGFVTLVDGDNEASLEFERIESVRPLAARI